MNEFVYNFEKFGVAAMNRYFSIEIPHLAVVEYKYVM